MKKILYKIGIGIIGLLVFTGSVEAKTTYQDFPTVKLRHGYHYQFSDIFNAGSYKVGFNKYSAEFTESANYNGGPDPKFDWTDWIKAHDYQLDAIDSKRIYEATSNYHIVYHPVTRKSDNLFIKYTTEYMVKINGKWNGPHTHIENQPYTITWCGDGVRDDYTDKYTGDHIYEACDPNDPKKVGWGTGGCSNACQPVEAQPVCNGLTYETSKNPIKIGEDDLTKTVSCTATNATKIKIDCGNGTTQEFSGNKTGKKTVSKACTYTTAGTYTPKCYVNTTITNNSCKKSLTVLNPTPAIEIIKTDFNTDDEDTVIGNDSQTVIKGNKAVFKITVKNIGGEDLKDVVITDAVEPSCNRTASQTKALYSGNVFKKGDSFSYTCKKDNTQANYTNTAAVTGKGVISGKNVDDSDPTRVLVVTPRCTNLTATPNEGTVAFESILDCTAQYATSYKIEIKDSNGNIISTIKNSTGKYNFVNAGDYTASCYINNKTTTEQACITNIKAKPAPVPSIKIDKRDENSQDRDHNTGNDTQTVYKGDKAVFKITVTNNGNEDLKNVVITDAKAPDCNRNSAQTKALYSGDVFKVGDSFTYTCEKSNTTENYTNTAGVTAIGVGSNDNVDDTDPTDIKIVEPVCTNLSVDKTSGDVTFTSHFTCTGNNVDSYKIIVKDGSATVVKTINSNVGQYDFANPGTYSVECYMNDETETEDVCKKTVVANENTNPSIKIDKTDANEALDTDGEVGNDTQTVINGNKAEFKITVENDGTEDLTNIKLEDEKASNCSGSVVLPNNIPSTFKNFTVFGAGDHTDNILQPGEKFTYTCEKSNTTENYTNSATVKANSTKDNTEVNDTDTTEVKTGVFDLALTKEVVNPKSSYKKDDIVEFAIAVKNQGTITASGVVVTDYIPEGLELNDVSWTQTGSMATRNIGDVDAGNVKTVNITFKITSQSGSITNWAEISSTANNLEDCDSTPDNNKDNDKYSTDYDSAHSNPEGCNKNGDDEDDHDPATITVLEQKFDLALRKTVVTTGSHKVGDTIEYKIEVINQGDLTAIGVVVTDYIPEKMELVSFSGSTWTALDAERRTTATIDSIAPGSSEELTIKLVISAGATGTINNFAEISEDNGEDCDSTADNQNQNTDGEKDEKLIDDNVGGRCDTSNTDEDDHDIAPITVSTGGGGGHSGGVPKCYNIEVKGTTVKCIGNSRAKSFAVVCNTASGSLSTTGKFKIGTNGSATFDCDSDLNKPKCYVYGTETTSYGNKAWKSSDACTIKSTKICGDGHIDTPNDNGVNEECDLGAKNGSNSTCSSDCKLNSKNSDFTPNCSNSFKYYNEHKEECDSNSTRPSGGEVEITTISNFAIGKQNLFDYRDSKNYFNTAQYSDLSLEIKNIGDEPMQLEDHLYLMNTNTDNIIDFTSKEDTQKIGMIYPGQTYYYRKNISSIMSNPDNIVSGTSETAELILTVKESDGTTYEWSPILAGKIYVTVAKPSIANQGGGTSYIADSSNISNVNDIANKVSNHGNNVVINTNQNNFVATVLGSGSNLSEVDTINDDTLIENANTESSEVEESSDVITNNIVTTEFEPYNGLNNVFVKTGTGEVSNINIPTDKSVTYIIKDGDLVIDQDIISTKNIAFIVKNGDVIILDNVKRIDATIVNIGGEIKSNGVSTDEQLVINGTLYGKTKDLINDRTHISMDSDGNISVGTIVNYGANILNKPAPLVGQFIKEYEQSNKIAQ